MYGITMACFLSPVVCVGFLLLSMKKKCMTDRFDSREICVLFSELAARQTALRNRWQRPLIQAKSVLTFLSWPQDRLHYLGVEHLCWEAVWCLMRCYSTGAAKWSLLKRRLVIVKPGAMEEVHIPGAMKGTVQQFMQLLQMLFIIVLVPKRMRESLSSAKHLRPSFGHKIWRSDSWQLTQTDVLMQLKDLCVLMASHRSQYMQWTI